MKVKAVNAVFFSKLGVMWKMLSYITLLLIFVMREKKKDKEFH